MKLKIKANKVRLYWVYFSAVIFLFASGCKEGEGTDTSSNTITQTSGDHNYVVNADNLVAPIQSTMYGIFYEDINFAADGGLYAELIKNRSFEFFEPLMGWVQPESDRWSLNANSGFASTINHGNNAANSKFLRAKVKAENGYRLVNNGFRGIGLKQGAKYNFSMDARQIEGSTTLHIELQDTSGNIVASEAIAIASGSWKEYTAQLTPNAEVMKGKLNIRFEGVGVVDLDMISLFPEDTWKNRPKGLRADLVQLLADLQPGFLRFPGGCIVEGRTLDRRYQWKKTVGDIDEREGLINRWNTEFAHRLTPDYFQTFGLGFFEYFQLSEDLGAEPLPILSCGMACQFNTGELVPLDELDPYIDDALDLIEFANGPASTGWGKLRAEMGHPAPFNMKYIGIGNEQWGPEFIERYAVFDKAIKEKYPDIIIVSGSGPFPDGEMFEFGWEELKKMDVEIIDEHYYRPPEWFRENADRYDDYDRNGPKVFAGEYAAQSVAIASPDNKNNWNCALSEAAFMTGLERNADIVTLTSYAPLFAHAEGWQWTPDLIWFNNLESYGTPNYYVQKLFSNNPGTHLLTLTENDHPVIGEKGLYASATLDENTSEVILKIVNITDAAQKVSVSIPGKTPENSGKLTVLTSNDKDAENSFEKPQNIYPVEKEINFEDNNISLSAEPQSLSVVRIKI